MENRMRADVLILGGGAAGMAAAIQLAEIRNRAGQPGRILLADRMEKPGKKLLATGNGRCNLGNRNVSAAGYATRSPRRLEEILAGAPFERQRAFFENHGLLCDLQPDGRMYPYSYFAGTVVEALRRSLRAAGVEELAGFEAVRLEKADGGFCVTARDGRALQAGQVLLAAGGKAAPALGSDGSGLELAASLGHTLHPVWPALTAFTSSSPLCRDLKGVRAAARAGLYSGGRLLAEDTGEVQFTEYGLSGIPFFQLSLSYGMLPPARRQGISARVDLFPARSAESLAAWLARQGGRGCSAGEALEGMLHWKLARAVGKAAGIPEKAPLDEAAARRLAAALKGLEFPISGTLGWEQCQVTGGGVSLEEVDPVTMESRLCPGLYLAGEILDAAGLCGGYKLHWAFGTGLLAGRGMAGECAIGQGRPAPEKKRREGPAPKRKKPAVGGGRKKR